MDGGEYWRINQHAYMWCGQSGWKTGHFQFVDKFLDQKHYIFVSNKNAI